MAPTPRFAAAVTILGTVLGLALCPAAMARQGAGDPAGTWALRGFGAVLATADDTLRSGQPIDPLPPLVEQSVTLDDGSGFGLALEYRATRRLGIEALALFADLDVDVRLHPLDPPGPDATETRQVSSDLFGVGLNLHLTPGRWIDVYVGPLVARVRYGDLRSHAGGFGYAADFDDDTALGITLGADLPLGRSGAWAVTAALRQLWSTAAVTGTNNEVDVDPLIASAGFAYRWSGR